MSRDGAPRRVDQDHPVAYRFDEPSKGSLQHIRSRRDIARRLSVETAIIVERDQHMRVFAMMRHDDGLARRLQSPIGKAANEIRGRYALWFLRSEEHTSELQALMRISHAVFCLTQKSTRIKTQLVV